MTGDEGARVVVGHGRPRLIRSPVNVQVLASGDGRLILTGRRQPGGIHDARAWRESGRASLFRISQGGGVFERGQGGCGQL